MNFLSLLFSLIFVLPSTSLHIILPLYLYPDSSASAWGNITATVAAYPAVQWEIVVNPNSGPGTTSYPTDPNIIAGIAKLNSYPNVHTVGYVDTAHGQKALSSGSYFLELFFLCLGCGSSCKTMFEEQDHSLANSILFMASHNALVLMKTQR